MARLANKKERELINRTISEVWEYKNEYVEFYYSCSEEGKFHHCWIKLDDVTYGYIDDEITNVNFKPEEENKVNLKRVNEEFTKFMAIKNSSKPTSISYNFPEYGCTAELNSDYIKTDDFRVLKFFPKKDVLYRGVMIKKEQLNE